MYERILIPPRVLHLQDPFTVETSLFSSSDATESLRLTHVRDIPQSSPPSRPRRLDIRQRRFSDHAACLPTTSTIPLCAADSASSCVALISVHTCSSLRVSLRLSPTDLLRFLAYPTVALTSYVRAVSPPLTPPSPLGASKLASPTTPFLFSSMSTLLYAAGSLMYFCGLAVLVYTGLVRSFRRLSVIQSSLSQLLVASSTRYTPRRVSHPAN